MNAIIYVRVSTEEQAKKGYSIDGQTQRCKEYAYRMGYEVVKVFVEQGRSAKDLNRPELQSMFKYIKANHKNIDSLIFWKWDRLSRGEDSDYVELGTMFKKYGIAPLSTEENNDNSPEAKLMRRITFATSTYELDKDSQRTKMGLQKKAEEGHFPAKAPIGYINKRDSQDKGYIAIDDKQAFYVKKCFEYYASGMYSLDSLGEKMYQEGFKDKYGKPYRARKFEEILKNVFYIGDFIWGGKRYKGKHKPIISKKRFYEVQEKFGHTNKPLHNDKLHTYKRLIKCDKCGCYFTAETKKGGHNSGNYTYYHCTNKKKVHLNGLKDWTLSEYGLDLCMQFVIDTIEIPDKVIKLLKDRIVSNLDKLYLEENKRMDERNKELKELNLVIKNAYIDKVKGLLTEEQYIELSSEYTQRRDLLAVEVKESTDVNKNLYKNIDLIINFCNRIPEIFIKASIEEKQLLLRMIIDKITYAEGGIIQVKLKPIFEALRVIKLASIDSESVEVRTRQKPTDSEVLEYLSNFITLAVNSKVRTLETRIIPNKKDPEGSNLLNGADSGIRTHAYRNHNPRS